MFCKDRPRGLYAAPDLPACFRASAAAASPHARGRPNPTADIYIRQAR